MNRKRTGLAIIAAALLVAVVGGIVSANVMRVGMMDYEVYPCTYNANAGYYVPWDGNAAGQFWISAPRWEWGGEGVSLCADSDGDWRDNGVREGDPNPDFVNEYRRQQAAVNARRAAFSASLVRLAENREARRQAAATAAAIAAATVAAGGTPPSAFTDEELEDQYSAAVTSCDTTHAAAIAAAGDNDRAAIDAADNALGECYHTAVRDYEETARRVYSTLQDRCRAANPPNPSHPDGPDAQYQLCVSAGQLGRAGVDTGTVEVTVEDPDTGVRSQVRVRFEFRECASVESTPVPGDPGNPVETCETRQKRDRDGNLVFENGRPVMEHVLGDGRVLVTQVTSAPRILNPELTLNPENTPTPTPTPEVQPTPDTSIPDCDFALDWMNDVGDNFGGDDPNEQITWDDPGGDGLTYSYGEHWQKFDDYISDNC